jgi:orotate phosphoribosyltransferase
MGTSTAGIAHAAIVAHLMGLPMGYVRSGAQAPGRGNPSDGPLGPGQKVGGSADRLSTGGSVLDPVEVLRAAGAQVLGVASIFTYGMEKGVRRLAEADVKNVSLSNLDVLSQVAVETGYISHDEQQALFALPRHNPPTKAGMTVR